MQFSENLGHVGTKAEHGSVRFGSDLRTGTEPKFRFFHFLRTGIEPKNRTKRPEILGQNGSVLRVFWGRKNQFGSGSVLGTFSLFHGNQSKKLKCQKTNSSSTVISFAATTPTPSPKTFSTAEAAILSSSKP